jgi:hypothetical protein
MTRLDFPRLHYVLLRSSRTLPPAVLSELVECIWAEYPGSQVELLLRRPELPASDAAALLTRCGTACRAATLAAYWGRAEHSPDDILTGYRTWYGEGVLYQQLHELLNNPDFTHLEQRAAAWSRRTEPDVLTAVFAASTVPWPTRLRALDKLDAAAAARPSGRRGGPKGPSYFVPTVREVLGELWTTDPTRAESVVLRAAHLPGAVNLSQLPNRVSEPVQQVIVDSVLTQLRGRCGRTRKVAALREIAGYLGGSTGVDGWLNFLAGLTPDQRAALHQALADLPPQLFTFGITQEKVLTRFTSAEELRLTEIDAGGPVAGWLLDTYADTDPQWPILLRLGRTFTGTVAELAAAAAGVNAAKTT